MNWKESLKAQVGTLSNILINSNANLDNAIKNFINIIVNSNGIIYFSGVGKNGHCASKIASTYNSLGIRSSFVNPVDTLHGDMGLFSKDDVIVGISKSGETEELICFINMLSRRGFKNIVAVTSSPVSTLARKSKLTLTIPIKNEGDHIGNIVPLASTITYEAVLQAIAIEIASKRGYGKKDFILSHPGGTIGRLK